MRPRDCGFYSTPNRGLQSLVVRAFSLLEALSKFRAKFRAKFGVKFEANPLELILFLPVYVGSTLSISKSNYCC